METKKYTIFTKYPSGYRGFIVRRGSLDDCIEETAGFEMQAEGFATPVAWDCPRDGARASCAESLAAGRTIELIDGKYVARGVVEPKPAQTLADLLREAGQGLPSKAPTLDKLEADRVFRDALARDAAEDLAMIARDGPAKQTFIKFTCVDCTGCAKCAPVSTAKPALSFLTYSPDLQPSSHLVAPAHGSALLRG